MMMLFQGNEKLGISHSFMKSSLIVGFILQNLSIKHLTLSILAVSCLEGSVRLLLSGLSGLL